ncbi:MAG: lysylphosphatidylglycerol synthase transmembrane domain-containing protein [Candidatus Paceibacterota bacterium]
MFFKVIDIDMKFLKKILLFVVSLIVGLALLFGVVEKVGWQEIVKSFFVFRWWKALIIIGLTLLRSFFALWKYKLILKADGLEVPIKKIIPSFYSGYPLMFFAPEFLMSGDFLRGYALQKTEDLPWRKTIGAVVVDRMLDWGVSLITIFLGVFIFLFRIGLPPKNISLILGGSLLGMGAGLFFLYFKNIREESILKLFGVQGGKAIEVEEEVHSIFQSGWRRWVMMLFPSAMVGITRVIRIWVLIIFLGETISILNSIPLLAFFYLGAGVPIPASLGVHETIQTFAFTKLSLGAGTATAFSMILRAGELILALLGSIALIKIGWNIFRKILLERLNGNS